MVGTRLRSRSARACDSASSGLTRLGRGMIRKVVPERTRVCLLLHGRLLTVSLFRHGCEHRPGAWTCPLLTRGEHSCSPRMAPAAWPRSALGLLLRLPPRGPPATQRSAGECALRFRKVMSTQTRGWLLSSHLQVGMRGRCCIYVKKERSSHLCSSELRLALHQPHAARLPPAPPPPPVSIPTSPSARLACGRNKTSVFTLAMGRVYVRKGY